MQTREEAISWCKKYLPKWPDINPSAVYNDLARPMTWKWVNKRIPYMVDDELVLINGKDDCIPIRESHVWPVNIPSMPSCQPIIFPEHVNKFIDTLKEMVKLKNSSNEITDVYQILMNQDEFDKICKDYPPVAIMCNNTRTGAVVRGISVVVVDPDLLLVIKFINIPGVTSLFTDSIQYNTDINVDDDGTLKRIIEKLINTRT